MTATSIPLTPVAVRRLNQVVEQADLLGADLTGNQLRHRVEIGALFKQISGRQEILRGGRGESERPGILVNPQAHDGGFIGADGKLTLAQHTREEGHGGPYLPLDPGLGGDVVGPRGMMVVNMNLETGVVQNAGQGAETAGLTRVDQHDPPHGIQIQVPHFDHVEQIDHRADEKVAQVFFLGPRKNHQGLGIKLLRRQHRRHGIEIGVDMAGDQRQSARFRSLGVAVHRGKILWMTFTNFLWFNRL